jgi:hypothetical protein
MIKYKPESIARAAEESRQVGAAEVTPSPMVAPNAKRIDDSAVAIRAPRMIGVQLA